MGVLVPELKVEPGGSDCPALVNHFPSPECKGTVFALQDLRQPRCPSQVWVCPLAPEPTLFTGSEIPRVVKGLAFRAVRLL